MNLAVDPTPVLDQDRLDQDRLDQIRSRVVPTVLAHEQTMPVSVDLAELFAERALVHGRTLGCTGPAATSTAMSLVAATVIAGSWLAVVDVPTFGLDAASEAGIPLERVVGISTGDPGGMAGERVGGMAGEHVGGMAGERAGGMAGERVGAGWVDVMAAAVDGFDIVLSRQPQVSPPEAALRKLSTRIRQRGAVVVLLHAGSTGFQCDGVIETSGISWSGLGSGYGHLRQRTVDLSATGRRFLGRRHCTIRCPEI